MSDNETQSDAHSDNGHATRQKPHYDDVNTPVVLLISVISGIVTFAIVAAVQGMYYQFNMSKLNDLSTRTMGAKHVMAEKEIVSKGDQTRKIEPILPAMKEVVSELGGTWEKKKTRRSRSPRSAPRGI